MRSESLQESISALMDGEAEQLEVRRVLQATDQDPAVRGTWERYQLARAVMHKEPWQAKVDLSAGIAAALANESAPRASAKLAGAWHTLGKFAVAASVTVAVLVGVRMVNEGSVPGESTIVAERSVPAAVEQVQAPAVAPQPGTAVLAGFQSSGDVHATPAAPAWQEQRIGDYLRKHAENAAQSPAPQLVPQARAASLDDQ
ncbi:anti sigma-E protein, RseA [Halopseudomonas xinjiangensis]|uniref:Anti sigma-E protein, RseA n=1 Tax=Halopseudomonas xinjiangensis TaxID=487184 RepID=A0A1H1V8G1_9GAMM|nr:RseA family anti-sigma factor [Halopseudomonas xinjiangensis]SDS80549.1 anti sigma-E protein, RseA [Halopseudomonas xinjiangensis]